jgi:hypothetical protein
MLALSSMREATMHRLASKPQPRSKTPRIVAKLDLSDDLQRELHAFFQRMHTGRWPTLRALAVRQQKDGTILEAVEWVREKSSRFAVVEWSTHGGVLSWHCLPVSSRKAAMARLVSAGRSTQL